MVALWRFNEASGDATDSSGNGNTGTFVGTAGRAAGMAGFGNAGDFDNNGSSNYVEVPGSAGLQIGLNAGDPWSVATWAYEEEDGAAPGTHQSVYGTFLHYRRTLSNDFPYPTPVYGLSFQSGNDGDSQLYLWHGSNGAWQRGTGITPTLNDWTHYAYVYDGTNIRVYADGVEQYTVNAGAADATYSGYTGALQIGGAPGFTASRNWNGQLDDVAIFNQALSPIDIAAIMAGDFTAFGVPEPASAILALGGTICLFGWRARRRW
jgi:hypothetical protein